jgi:hypothetical protein
VALRLLSMGVTTDDGYSIATDLAAIVRELERLTGRKPFLGSGTSTVSLDPPHGRTGDLRLRIPDFASIDSVSSDDVELAEETDYLLHRWDEYDEDSPYAEIEFLTGVSCQRRGISVAGTRGYCTVLPADVYAAVLDEAAARYIERHAGEGGNAVKMKIGDYEIAYDTTAGRDVVTRMRRPFADVCNGLRRDY